MKKILILLLLIPIAQAATISEWPDFFVQNDKFRAKYVVGEKSPSLDVISATVISTSLAKFENLTTAIGTSTLDIEISDITIYNAIVIGSPCENRAAMQLMGDPDPCSKDLGGSVGYIKLFENNGKVQLLITGLDEKDRHSAAKYLAGANLSNLTGHEYIVQSASGSTPAFFEQKKVESASTNVSTNVTPVTVTNVTKTVSVPVVENISEEVGPYDSLEELPEKKGFFARLWSWLKSIFT